MIQVWYILLPQCLLPFELFYRQFLERATGRKEVNNVVEKRERNRKRGGKLLDRITTNSSWINILSFFNVAAKRDNLTRFIGEKNSHIHSFISPFLNLLVRLYIYTHPSLVSNMMILCKLQHKKRLSERK